MSVGSYLEIFRWSSLVVFLLTMLSKLDLTYLLAQLQRTQ